MHAVDAKLRCSLPCRSSEEDGPPPPCESLGSSVCALGPVSEAEHSHRLFNITNTNALSVALVKVQMQAKGGALKDLDGVQIRRESVFDLATGEMLELDDADDLTMLPRSITVLSLSLSRGHEGKRATLTLFFTPERGTAFNASFSYEAYKGSISFTPMILNFKGAFSGVTQEKALTLISEFKTPVTILNVESTDKRIAVKSSSAQIEPRARHELTVVFDPSRAEQSVLSSPNASRRAGSKLTHLDVLHMRLKNNLWD